MNDFDFNRAIKNFQDVVTNHYADFSGRVSRRDYWTYVAVMIAVMIVASIAGGIPGLGFIRPLVSLGLLLPNMGMTARRLQDTGRSGTIVWALAIPMLIISAVALFGALSLGVFAFLILIFLPIMFLIDLIALVVAIYLIYLCTQPGTAGDNRFGPQPVVTTATGMAA